MGRDSTFGFLSNRRHARADASAEDGIDMNYKQGLYTVTLSGNTAKVVKNFGLVAVFHGPDRANNAVLFLTALRRKRELESVEQGEAKGGG